MRTMRLGLLLTFLLIWCSGATSAPAAVIHGTLVSETPKSFEVQWLWNNVGTTKDVLTGPTNDSWNLTWWEIKLGDSLAQRTQVFLDDLQRLIIDFKQAPTDTYVRHKRFVTADDTHHQATDGDKALLTNFRNPATPGDLLDDLVVLPTVDGDKTKYTRTVSTIRLHRFDDGTDSHGDLYWLTAEGDLSSVKITLRGQHVGFEELVLPDPPPPFETVPEPAGLAIWCALWALGWTVPLARSHGRG